MVWEEKTKAILMLNKLMEKKQVKCDLYWPTEKGPENALKLNKVNLTVEYLRCEEYMNFCRRWFKYVSFNQILSQLYNIFRSFIQ